MIQSKYESAYKTYLKLRVRSWTGRQSKGGSIDAAGFQPLANSFWGSDNSLLEESLRVMSLLIAKLVANSCCRSAPILPLLTIKEKNIAMNRAQTANFERSGTLVVLHARAV
jgi:hypothetical protein